MSLRFITQNPPIPKNSSDLANAYYAAQGLLIKIFVTQKGFWNKNDESSIFDTIARNNAIVAEKGDNELKRMYCRMLYAARELSLPKGVPASPDHLFVRIEHNFRTQPQVQFKKETDFLDVNIASSNGMSC